MAVVAGAGPRLFDGIDGEQAGADGQRVRQGDLHHAVHGGLADEFVMVGLAAHDAAQGHEAVEAAGAAQRDADGLREFKGAGHVQHLEGGAGFPKEAVRTVQQAVHHVAVVGRAHDQQMGRRAFDGGGGGKRGILGAHSPSGSSIGR